MATDECCLTREHRRRSRRVLAVELEGELTELAAHMYAGTCRWLELIAELDRRGVGLPGDRGEEEERGRDSSRGEDESDERGAMSEEKSDE